MIYGKLKDIKKRKSMVVTMGIPLVVTVGFFGWLVSLGPFSGD